jgi:hypothetical protein
MPIPHIKIPQLTPQEIARFWDKVNKAPGFGPNGDCWIWTGGKSTRGYGLFTIRRRSYRANRIAYTLQYNTDPNELLACHRCDIPLCVRKEHLFADTNQGNMLDAKKKNRLAVGKRSGAYTKPEKVLRGDTHPCRKHPDMHKGERNGRATITANDVAIMRQDFVSGMTRMEIARKYNRRWGTVSDVVLRKTWRHL